MDRRLSELEKLAFTEVNGETSLRIEGVTGTETAVPQVRLSQLQKDAFTMVGGEVAVRVTGTAGGGSCTIEGSVSTQSINFFDGTTLAGNSRNWNQANNGFQWVIQRGDAQITQLCENTLVTPLPIEGGAMGDLALVSILLNGVDITSRATANFNPTTGLLTISDVDDIINPDVTSTNSIPLQANLTIGGESVTLNENLIYREAQFTLEIETPNLDFNAGYTTATITRTFAAGTPTNQITTFAGNVINSALTNITFNELNRTADVASRTLTERAFFNNPTSAQIGEISRTVVLTPVFTFPAYLGSLETLTGINTSIINTFDKSPAVFTSLIQDQNFTWSDPMNDDRDIKVFAVPRALNNNGRTISFKTSITDPAGNIQTPLSASPIDVGTISGALESYDVYEAQMGQPGAITLFVDFV